MPESALQRQRQLVERLCDPACYPWPVDRVEWLETHISYVLLAGEFALKIKKPLNLGFLNYTSLDKRRHYCEEEIRLNSRLAPDYYLRVLAIDNISDKPRFDTGNPSEYAVLMRRFPSGVLMNELLIAGRLTADAVDKLAVQLADFHQRIEVAVPGEGRGDLARVAAPILENFKQLERSIVGLGSMEPSVRALRDWNEGELKRRSELIAERLASGFVRECHGDLHLGNIACFDKRVLIFDGIEFSEQLRWIDVISEVAFAVMDFDYRNASYWRHRLLDIYLAHTGDYAGLSLLRFYAGYRAMVRAKVSALRAEQYPAASAERDDAIQQAHAHIQLASRYREALGARLVITCGLSGAGKSTVAAQRVERDGFIRLRSDVERKRLFGLSASQRASAPPAKGLYTPEASLRTQQRLLSLARHLLREGFPVLVDAAFLRRSDRQHFCELAAELACPFQILYVRARGETLRQRVRNRLEADTDPSDATEAVLEHQLRTAELPGEDEKAVLEVIDTDP